MPSSTSPTVTPSLKPCQRQFLSAAEWGGLLTYGLTTKVDSISIFSRMCATWVYQLNEPVARRPFRLLTGGLVLRVSRDHKR